MGKNWNREKIIEWKIHENFSSIEGQKKIEKDNKKIPSWKISVKKF